MSAGHLEPRFMKIDTHDLHIEDSPARDLIGEVDMHRGVVEGRWDGVCVPIVAIDLDLENGRARYLWPFPPRSHLLLFIFFPRFGLSHPPTFTELLPDSTYSVSLILYSASLRSLYL
jgi:hypothetical protein